MPTTAPACELVHANEAHTPLLEPLLSPFSRVWGDTTARPNALAAPTAVPVESSTVRRHQPRWPLLSAPPPSSPKPSALPPSRYTTESRSDSRLAALTATRSHAVDAVAISFLDAPQDLPSPSVRIQANGQCKRTCNFKIRQFAPSEHISISILRR
jgi:hypothetical protein